MTKRQNPAKEGQTPAERAAAERIAQGLPPKVTDPEMLAKIAAIVDPDRSATPPPEVAAIVPPTKAEVARRLAPILLRIAQRLERERRAAGEAEQATTSYGAEERRRPKADSTSATLSVAEAADLLGISDAHAYRLIHRDEFPAPVLHMGRTYRVPRKPLERLLGLHDDEPPGDPSAT